MALDVPPAFGLGSDSDVADASCATAFESQPCEAAIQRRANRLTRPCAKRGNQRHTSCGAVTMPQRY